MKLLFNKSKESIRILLTKFLPNGIFWDAKRKQDTNIYKLINALSDEYKRVKDLLYSIVNNRYVDDTELLLEQWEKDLQLPDECLPLADTISERQKNILFKYTAKGIQTVNDFYTLANIFGINIEIITGVQASKWPWSWPHLFVGTAEQARFVFVVKFVDFSTPSGWPWTWPHSWEVDPTTSLQCILNKLKPANVKIVYIFND
jgi:uncharacterized protein YmfQ (DUF2313 family)